MIEFPENYSGKFGRFFVLACEISYFLGLHSEKMSGIIWAKNTVHFVSCTVQGSKYGTVPSNTVLYRQIRYSWQAVCYCTMY